MTAIYCDIMPLKISRCYIIPYRICRKYLSVKKKKKNFFNRLNQTAIYMILFFSNFPYFITVFFFSLLLAINV